MKYWHKKTNGWVFLSHSSADYESVKIVRNYLEDNGFSAIIFYLKCLEEKDKKEYIQKLLEWEIKSRNIFVLCNSETARKSEWVQWETTLVKSLPSKIFKELDMDNLMLRKCTELSKLDNLMDLATLYFLYSHKDTKVKTIYEKLSSLGFRIFMDTHSIKVGDNITSKLDSALKETKDKGGIVLAFLSKNAMDSQWFWKEKDMALKSKALIIPIILDHTPIHAFPAFYEYQYIDMSDNITNQHIDKLIMTINRIKQNHEI